MIQSSASGETNSRRVESSDHAANAASRICVIREQDCDESFGAAPFAGIVLQMRRVAFTLVELLVVIGIIAILAATLLATISRAQQQAQQTMCLSNLRQLGIVYVLYANSNAGQIPIGYSNGMPWNGYFLWDGINYPLSGQVSKSRLLDKSPRAFYCPSQIDDRWRFDTTLNPWPSQTGNPSATLQIRVGYTCRPTVEWAPGSFKPTGPMTRIRALGNRAMLADIIGIPKASADFTNVHHRSLNVLYADGSAHNVDRSAYDSIQRVIQPYNAVPNAVPVKLYIDATNPNAAAIWNAFDRN